MTDQHWTSALAATLRRVGADPAALAACRRGVGKPAMSVPEMWPYAVPVVDRVPEQPRGYRARVEDATHHALALYAIHQQSQRTSMHAAHGPSVGAGCRRLAATRTSEGARRRFHAAATADTVPELVGHLRGLVTLLRGEGIPLDYIRLATDITDWPRPERRTESRRRWGLDFHADPATATATRED